MNMLNIIDNIYENSHFTTALIASVVILVVLFIIVLIIGIKDSKKSKNPSILLEEDIKDISFDIPADAEKVKEDVTFEMPVLTTNLENFKKNLEEEIKTEEMAEIRKLNKDNKQKDKKMVKVLDMDELKDTAIIEIASSSDNDKESIPSEHAEKKLTNDVITVSNATSSTEDSVYDLSDDF